MSLLDLKFANFSEIKQDEVRNFCLPSVILLNVAPRDLTLCLLHCSTFYTVLLHCSALGGFKNVKLLNSKQHNVFPG